MKRICFAFVATGTFAYASPHFYRVGVLTTSNFYQDNVLKKGLLSGNYRPFGSYEYDGKYSVFLRGNLTLKYYPEKPEAEPRQASAVGALEMANFEAKWGDHTLSVGRGFYQTEQGILFANFADGVSYEGKTRFGTLKAMGLYSADYGKSSCAININGCAGEPNPFNTIPELAPDATVTGSGQRVFATLEYTSREIELGAMSMAALAYGIYSRDLLKENSAVVTRYEYNPYYAGLGATGYLFSSKLQYRVEGIYQGGDAFNVTSNGESLRTNISAAAALGQVTYSLPVLTQVDAKTIVETAFASGDNDASRAGTASQSNTAGNYTAFQTFGAYSGGLALKPRLTNIQIYRLGFESRPLKMFYWARNVGLSLKYSLYRKNSAAGGISDATATEPSSDIGMAGDAGINVAARGDLQFFYGFGIFKPGEAYPTTAADGSDGRGLRHAHIVSLTLIF